MSDLTMAVFPTPASPKITHLHRAMDEGMVIADIGLFRRNLLSVTVDGLEGRVIVCNSLTKTRKT